MRLKWAPNAPSALNHWPVASNSIYIGAQIAHYAITGLRLDEIRGLISAALGEGLLARSALYPPDLKGGASRAKGVIQARAAVPGTYWTSDVNGSVAGAVRPAATGPIIQWFSRTSVNAFVWPVLDAGCNATINP